MGLGVVVDTLVVRTLFVPAVISILGDRFWWPSRPAHTPRHAEDIDLTATPEPAREPALTR